MLRVMAHGGRIKEWVAAVGSQRAMGRRWATRVAGSTARKCWRPTMAAWRMARSMAAGCRGAKLGICAHSAARCRAAPAESLSVRSRRRGSKIERWIRHGMRWHVYPVPSNNKYIQSRLSKSRSVPMSHGLPESVNQPALKWKDGDRIDIKYKSFDPCFSCYFRM